MKQRNYGIDLLRSVSMIMVLTLHILGHGGVKNFYPSFTQGYYLSDLLEAFAFCGVNLYALTSGYVGYDKEFKLSNIIYSWIKVFIYSFLITLLFQIFIPTVCNLNIWGSAFLPVSSNQYWYFSCYFVVALIAPLINAGLNILSKKEWMPSEKKSKNI